ncbi:MAG: hypothetical protein LUP94_03600, partial [Candidatus Methanomethylicus sp.]|nr:hypothetical protein [Candidatus Methanomethylicus sp.]
TIDKAILDDFSKRHFVLRPLIAVISDVGLTPSSPGIITGKSGYQHTFSAVGTDKSGKFYAFDVAVSNALIEESVVLNMFAKILDTKPEMSYLVCMPGINENGKKIAAVYDIKLVEGKSMEEIMKALKEVLASKSEESSEPSLPIMEINKPAAAPPKQEEAVPTPTQAPAQPKQEEVTTQEPKQEAVATTPKTENVAPQAPVTKPETPAPFQEQTGTEQQSKTTSVGNAEEQQLKSSSSIIPSEIGKHPITKALKDL